MKQNFSILALLIMSTTVVNASLPENTWYIGEKQGWTAFYDTKSQKVAGTTDVSNDDFNGGIFVGFQASPYFAVELGHDWLGTLKYKGTSGNKSTLTVYGASFTGKLNYPVSFISDDLDIYARAGIFIHNTKWNVPGYSASEDTNASPVYALGFDYRFNKHYSTRLEYQWVNNIDNKGVTRPDNGFLSIGFTYRLGSPDISQASKFEYVKNRFVLNESILFDYAQFKLKKEGEHALDQLLDRLVTLNSTESAIVVIGHTDRIGSVGYNQRLSEQRAKATIAYLKSKGISADIISGYGVGKSQSVTGNTCDGFEGAELRKCLSPDRRVEIEIRAHNIKKVKVDLVKRGNK